MFGVSCFVVDVLVFGARRVHQFADVFPMVALVFFVVFILFFRISGLWCATRAEVCSFLHNQPLRA